MNYEFFISIQMALEGVSFLNIISYLFFQDKCYAVSDAADVGCQLGIL